MALNCRITWTAKQNKLILFQSFNQKYYNFYLAVTVINLLNRSMYKILIFYFIMYMCICIFYYVYY